MQFIFTTEGGGAVQPEPMFAEGKTKDDGHLPAAGRGTFHSRRGGMHMDSLRTFLSRA